MAPRTLLTMPPEMLLHILFFLEPYIGPGSEFRSEHIVLQKTVVSWMCLSRTHYRLAQRVLYHTMTSGQLNGAMQRVNFRVTRCAKIARLVRVLYANYNESRTMTNFGNLPSVPIVMFQVGFCMNLQALVLSRTTYPRRVLPSQLLRNRNTLAPGWPASSNLLLANLCRFEIHPDEWLRDDLDLESDGWLLLLAKLPQMKTISVPTITERALVPPREQAPSQQQASPEEQEQLQEQPLNTKSLALTSQPLTPGLLEAVLKTFQLLEELSVTWPQKGRIWLAAADIWPELGRVLHEHGLSLRKIHFEYKRESRGSLMNLAGLSGLQSLALPIDAVISEPVSRQQAATTAGGAGQALLAPHGAGSGSNTFTIPLIYLLPPNISSLTIMDHRNLQADAHRLDNQLRDLMVHRTFSGLRTIRLRRSRPFIQSGGWGWFKHSPDRFWQVLERR